MYGTNGDSHPMQERDTQRSLHTSQDRTQLQVEIFFSGISYLIFFNKGYLQVTEITGEKNDKMTTGFLVSEEIPLSLF